MNWKIINAYPDAETEQKWFDFLPLSNFPCHYTSPAFFLEPFWKGKNPFALLVFDDGKIVAALTGLKNEKQIISGLEVRPQVSIAKDSNQAEVIKYLAAGLEDFAEKKTNLITVHCAERATEFAGCGFTEKKAAGNFEVIMLDLSNGADAVFKSFSQSRRSDLRKAMRQNQVQISQLETLDELKELHQIHVEWCERKQIAPDSWEMMESIFAQQNFRRIFIAKHDGKIIAGSYFRFFPKALMEYTANNSLPEFQHLRPNDLIVWKSIEWACGQGMKQYSMGGSHLFLRRFGGELVSSYRYRIDRTFLKSCEKKEAVREMLIKTYQRIPNSTRRKLKKIIGKS